MLRRRGSLTSISEDLTLASSGFDPENDNPCICLYLCNSSKSVVFIGCVPEIGVLRVVHKDWHACPASLSLICHTPQASLFSLHVAHMHSLGFHCASMSSTQVMYTNLIAHGPSTLFPGTVGKTGPAATGSTMPTSPRLGIGLFASPIWKRCRKLSRTSAVRCGSSS